MSFGLGETKSFEDALNKVLDKVIISIITIFKNLLY